MQRIAPGQPMQRHWNSKPKRYWRGFRPIGRRTFWLEGTAHKEGNELVVRRVRVRSSDGRLTIPRRGSECNGSGTRNQRGTDSFPSSVVPWIALYFRVAKAAPTHSDGRIDLYVPSVPGCTWTAPTYVLYFVAEQVPPH